MKHLAPTSRLMVGVAVLSFSLLAGVSQAQTTHTVGTTGGDFADLATAIAAPAVVAGDTLLLDPANNGGNPFAPTTINKTVTVQGQNGAAIVGGNLFLGAVVGEVILKDLEVSGAVGNNGVVINGDDTIATLDNVTVQNKPNFGLNINAGTVYVINGSRFLNNGGAGISQGASADVYVQGTAENPILVQGNGFGQINDVQRAGISGRLMGDLGSRTWLVEHTVISGSPFGYVNQFFNTGVEDVVFRNVTITDVSESAIQINGQNLTFAYEGGTISGRTTPYADIIDEINIPLIHMRGDESLENTFTGSNLTFPGGDYATRLRNDSGPMVISDSTIIGGSGGLSGIFAGGMGVTLINCTLQSSAAPMMIGVGGTETIRLTDPTFQGAGTPVPFWLQGLDGDFIIEGTDPENKVDLDMANVAVVIRKAGGVTTLRNVTATTNGSLYDCYGIGELSSPVTLNIEQSTFYGTGGIVDMIAAVPSAQPVTINATNSLWRGNYSPTPHVLSVNDPNRTTVGAVNLVHSTVAPASTGAVVINAQPGRDLIESDSSVFDASGAGALVASTVELEGQRNLSYSTGGATASGGWVTGFPEDTIIAEPQLAANGELTVASPAINNAIGSTMIVDYRGTVRPQGDAPDIGAHEFSGDVVIPAYEGFQVF